MLLLPGEQLMNPFQELLDLRANLIQRGLEVYKQEFQKVLDAYPELTAITWHQTTWEGLSLSGFDVEMRPDCSWREDFLATYALFHDQTREEAENLPHYSSATSEILTYLSKRDPVNRDNFKDLAAKLKFLNSERYSQDGLESLGNSNVRYFNGELTVDHNYSYDISWNSEQYPHSHQFHSAGRMKEFVREISPPALKFHTAFDDGEYDQWTVFLPINTNSTLVFEEPVGVENLFSDNVLLEESEPEEVEDGWKRTWMFTSPKGKCTITGKAKIITDLELKVGKIE